MAYDDCCTSRLNPSVLAAIEKCLPNGVMVTHFEYMASGSVVDVVFRSSGIDGINNLLEMLDRSSVRYVIKKKETDSGYIRAELRILSW